MLFINSGDLKFLIATCNTDEQPMLIDLQKDENPEGIANFDWVSNSQWTNAWKETEPQELESNRELQVLYEKIIEHLDDLHRQGQEESEENWLMERAFHNMAHRII